MEAFCPNDSSHNRFVTSAHEAHDWLVDEWGNFIEDRGCYEVTHKPMAENTWTCVICGAKAEVEND